MRDFRPTLEAIFGYSGKYFRIFKVNVYKRDCRHIATKVIFIISFHF